MPGRGPRRHDRKVGEFDPIDGGNPVKESALILVATLLCSTPSAALATEGPVETQSIVLTSGDFRIVSEPGERERVETDGFGALMAPGMPMLPAQTFLVAV